MIIFLDYCCPSFFVAAKSLKRKFSEISKNKKFLFLDLIFLFVISLLLMGSKQLDESEKGHIEPFNDWELSLCNIGK